MIHDFKRTKRYRTVRLQMWVIHNRKLIDSFKEFIKELDKIKAKEKFNKTLDEVSESLERTKDA